MEELKIESTTAKKKEVRQNNDYRKPRSKEVFGQTKSYFLTLK